MLRVFQEYFNEVCFANLLQHESHRSYPSRRRACFPCIDEKFELLSQIQTNLPNKVQIQTKVKKSGPKWRHCNCTMAGIYKIGPDYPVSAQIRYISNKILKDIKSSPLYENQWRHFFYVTNHNFDIIWLVLVTHERKKVVLYEWIE